MSATTPDAVIGVGAAEPAVPRTRETFGSRIRRLARRAKMAMKVGAYRFWSMVKRGGATVKRGAIKTGRSLKTAVVYLGKGVLWTASALLLAVAWVFSTVVSAAAIILTLAAALICAVLVLLFALVTGIATIAVGLEHLLKKYVAAPVVWVARDRKVTGLPLGEYLRLSHGTLRDQIFDRAGVYENGEDDDSSWTSLFRFRGNADERADRYHEEHWTSKETFDNRHFDEAFEEEVNLRMENDLEAADENFPGAMPLISNPENPYDEHNSYVPELDIIGNISEDNAREHDFSQYDDHASLIEVYEYYRDRARTDRDIQNASYWEGRIRMLQQYMKNSDRLDKHGRAWSLLHAELVNRQQEFSLKYVRAGFMDEVQALETRRNRQQGTRV